jgi:hypothetical protein
MATSHRPQVGNFVQTLENRHLVGPDGERFSLLAAGEPALPLFYPAVFFVERRRSAGLAASTLRRDGQVVLHLLVWADQSGIDLDGRFKGGRYLSTQEVASYARAVKRTLPQLRRKSLISAVEPPVRIARASLERFRAAASSGERGVQQAWASYRLWLAAEYLAWLADKTSPIASLDNQAIAARREARDVMVTALKSHMGGAGGGQAQKEGLSKELQDRLRDVVRPGSPENPWLSPYVQARNRVLVTFLLAVGSRKGEALKQKIRHVDVGRLQVTIDRSPDDPADPRRLEPNVKRVGRVVPIDEELADLLADFIVEWRSEIPGSEKTDFLLLTAAGRPMSQGGGHKVFTTLRNKFPEFPRNLSAHLLRHTWNDILNVGRARTSKPLSTIVVSI